MAAEDNDAPVDDPDATASANGDAAKAAAVAHAIPRLWRREPLRGVAAERARTRGRRIFATQARLMFVLAAVLLMLNMLRPASKPKLVAIWSAGGFSRVAATIPWAEADLEALTSSGAFEVLGQTPSTHQTRKDILDRLRELKSARRYDAVVVYVRARAVAAANDPRGDAESARANDAGRAVETIVYLLPDDADPLSRAGWVSLRELLTALRDDCRAARKLLVLDLDSRFEGSRLGVLTDSIEDRVRDDLKAVPDPRRHVLLPSNASTPPLVSEELGRSVFNYYFEQAFRGGADGVLEGKRGDGLLTLDELAAYLAWRVDRWAARNRGLRQIPVLLGGDGSDFTLAVLRRGSFLGFADNLKKPEPRSYPNWLFDAWRLRDGWLVDGAARLFPWGLQRLETSALSSEHDWRGGVPRVEIDARRLAPLESIEQALGRIRRPLRPAPGSLELARSFGAKPDAALVADLDKILKARADKSKPLKPDDERKLVDDWYARAAAKGDFPFAWAVVEAAAADPAPSPQSLVFLDDLLARKFPNPTSVETMSIRRLADRARLIDSGGGGVWSNVAARWALRAARLGALSETRPEALAALEAVAQTRHEGEVMIAEPGYASAPAAAARLERAARWSEAVLTFQDALESAVDTLNDALRLLPRQLTRIENSAGLESDWHAAVVASSELYEHVGAVSTQSDDGDPPDTTELRNRVDALNRRSQELGRLLDRIRRPTSTVEVNALLARSQAADADPSLWNDLDELLSGPTLPAPQRKAVWEAAHALAKRLLDQTLALERDEAAQGIAPLKPGDDEFDRAELDLPARRARHILDLLALGGYNTSQLKNIAALIPGDDGDLNRDGIARIEEALRRAWLFDVPRRIEAPGSLAARDRLSRVLTGGYPQPYLDDPRTNPTVVLRQNRDAALWRRLAERFQSERDDIDGNPFDEAASLGYQRAVRVDPSAPAVAIDVTPPRVQLGPSASQADLAARVLTAADPSKTRPSLAWITPDDPRLAVFSRFAPAPAPANPNETLFPLCAVWTPSESDDAHPVPRGFLLRAVLNRHSRHARVTIDLPAVITPWDVLISRNTANPVDPLEQIRLRPINDLQSFSIFLRNPSRQARKGLVTVRAGDLVLNPAPIALELGPLAAARVVLPDPKTPAVSATPAVTAAVDAKKSVHLDELPGPIRVQVVDPANPNRVLADRTFDVAVDSAGESVAVESATYRPAGPGRVSNRLSVTLRATRPYVGPPIFAELVLPPDRIPGWIGVESGDFRAAVLADGTPTMLFAEKIERRSQGEDLGMAYVTIDGIERAARLLINFGSSSDGPRGLRLDTRPDLRIRGKTAAPGGSPLEITTEVDDPPLGAQLEVSLGREEKGVFIAASTKLYDSPRRIRIGQGVAAGSLVFNASVSDHKVRIDTAGVEGARLIRARLVDARGNPIMTVVRPLLLDAEKPRVAFVSPPQYAKKGSTVVVSAVAAPSESGVARVTFFVGKPVNDAPPPGASIVQGLPVEPTGRLWSARLTLPSDRNGSVDLTAIFVNGVGLASTASAVTDLVDSLPAPPASISGRVVEGNRPQAGIDVVLADPKNKPLKTTKTDPDGHYLFSTLAAGEYRLFARKTASSTRRLEVVKIGVGESKTVDLDLIRR